MTSYQWNPTTDYIDGANVTRLARRMASPASTSYGRAPFADTAWYWDAAATDLRPAIPHALQPSVGSAQWN